MQAKRKELLLRGLVILGLLFVLLIVGLDVLLKIADFSGNASSLIQFLKDLRQSGLTVLEILLFLFGVLAVVMMFTPKEMLHRAIRWPFKKEPKPEELITALKDEIAKLRAEVELLKRGGSEEDTASLSSLWAKFNILTNASGATVDAVRRDVELLKEQTRKHEAFLEGGSLAARVMGEGSGSLKYRIESAEKQIKDIEQRFIDETGADQLAQLRYDLEERAKTSLNLVGEVGREAAQIGGRLIALDDRFNSLLSLFRELTYTVGNMRSTTSVSPPPTNPILQGVNRLIEGERKIPESPIAKIEMLSEIESVTNGKGAYPMRVDVKIVLSSPTEPFTIDWLRFEWRKGGVIMKLDPLDGMEPATIKGGTSRRVRFEIPPPARTGSDGRIVVIAHGTEYESPWYAI